MNEKQLRDAALLNALHPGIVVPASEDEIVQTDTPPSFDGGPRGELPPRAVEPPWGPSEDLGPAWREYEIEDGADLFFGRRGER